MTDTDQAAQTQEKKQERPAVIIGVASGIGAPDHRCGDGPDALHGGGLTERLVAAGANITWRTMLYPQEVRGERLYRAVSELSNRIAHEVTTALLAQEFPVVLGGDHSCAIGTWSGAARAIAPRGPLGLVWIDAHMDSHTPATSHSGMPHGMPLAALLGHGASRRLAAQVSASLSTGQLAPEHICLVGVRSHEPEEAELLERLGVRIFYMDEIEALGIDAVIGEAITIARTATAGYGITLDLDALDPADAPGVGSPVAGGLAAAPLLRALARSAGDPRLVGLEVVEYNPHLDEGQRTAKLVEDAIATVLGTPLPEARERATESAGR